MNTSKIQYLRELRTECLHEASGEIVLTDAPVDNKGKGENFSPTDLVATALGACAITIMGIVAEERGIDLEVKANCTKTMATQPRRISKILLHFYFKNKHSEKEQKLLKEAAKTCPVWHSLHPELEKEMVFEF